MKKAILLPNPIKDIEFKVTNSVAEKLVSMLYKIVSETMGEKNIKYAPYLGTLFTISICGSISSLFGVRPYTADLSVTLGWALVTFVMVQATSIKTNG